MNLLDDLIFTYIYIYIHIQVNSSTEKMYDYQSSYKELWLQRLKLLAKLVPRFVSLSPPDRLDY